jgi:site-specific DNA-methyltransferase (adenine-specific)
MTENASVAYYDGDGITLYLGDCTTETAWLAADVLVTDPPYGVAYIQGGPRSNVDGVRSVTPTARVIGDDTPAARDAALALWGNRPALVFGSWRVDRPQAVRQRLIWWKRNTNPGLGTATPWSGADEEIYVLGEGWVGPREVNVLVTDEARASSGGLAARVGHPTPKPVGLMERLIAKCPPGVIADPFAGSGATLLAARAAGRAAIGVEIDERYCELIATRLAQGDLFGETA